MQDRYLFKATLGSSRCHAKTMEKIEMMEGAEGIHTVDMRIGDGRRVWPIGRQFLEFFGDVDITDGY